MKYSHTKKLTLDFSSAVTAVRDALTKEGFGVLWDIDVKTAMKKKLDADFDNYTILGACNPPYAKRALETEQEVGLLLPCNVIVYERGGEVYASTILPSAAMSMVDNSALAAIAAEVEPKLTRAIDSV